MLTKLNLLLLSVSALTSSLALAQTNTFPASGNVGIGTTSPSTSLEVIGQDINFLSNTSINRFSFGRKSGEKFYLSVDDYTGFLDYIQDVDRNEPHIFYIRNRAAGTNNNNDIRFQTAGADRLTIKRNGYIGIGTSNPKAKLTVAGDVQAQMFVSGDFFVKANNAPRLRLREESSGQDAAIRVGIPGVSIDVEKVNNAIFIQKYGNVGIGTTKPNAKLTVAGNIRAREVKVTADAGADFVFEENYILRPLAEVEQFVKENKHLPEIAPAAEMVKEGVKTGEFQIQLLQKIEELTLYMIAMQKEVEALKRENEALRNALDNK